MKKKKSNPSVQEWIDEAKKDVIDKDIVFQLKSIIECAQDSYGYDMKKTYSGCYGSEEEDPWVQDILYVGAAIDRIEENEKLKEALRRCILHIECYEDELAEDEWEAMGINDEIMKMIVLKNK